MANNDGGGIYYEVELDASNMLSAAQKAKDTLDDIGSSASSAGKRLDSLQSDLRSVSQSSNQVANNTGKLTSGMDTLNTSVSGVAQAIQQAVAIQNMQTISLAQLNAGMNSLVAAAKSMASAMESAGSSTTTSTQSYTRAESAIEGLGNQIAILEEANENGARSAAILAAQLRLGADASDAQKAEVAQLTGTLYDMKNGVDTGGKSVGSWKNQMQQAGYQVQDFIVQVQGGQSALVAFAQQGSQLAGAFGPSGAVIGAIIALGSVLAGTLINSLGGAEDKMKTLATATQSLNEIINISQSGVAALSDKYALLANANTEAATILRNQAAIEYSQAISKIPDAISQASSSLLSFGDQVGGVFTGAIPSISATSKVLSDFNVQATDVNQALQQIPGTLNGNNTAMLTVANTVQSVADKFGISEQAAFDLIKQLDQVTQSKSPEQLQNLVVQLQAMKSSTDSGRASLITFIGDLVKVSTNASQAAVNLNILKQQQDNLTQSQKNALQTSERQLSLSKLQGAARAKLQAQYAAEDAGFKGDSAQSLQMQKEAEETYNNTQAQKQLTQQRTKSNSAAKQQASAEQSVQQKLDQLRQQSDLNAVSSQNLTLEQAKLRAEMSLGKNATEAQRKEAAAYAETIWQQSAALKARNLIPELAENDDYSNKTAQLEMLKGQKDAQGNLIISQEQYQQESEQLAADHIEKLAKIRSQQSVTPMQQAAGEVDPVQQLKNQQTEQMALIQQFENAGVISHQRAITLKQAADTAYQTNLVNAQWQILANQSTVNQALTSGFDAVSNSAGSALTGILTGTESVSDAMHSLVNSALSAVINSFVQAGAEWVKNIIIQKTMGSAAATLSMTEGASVASAWAPAAALSSLATLGGNAAPAAAGITGTVGLAQGFALAGLRANGGPVTSGSMYQVGESNKPEIYQTSTGSQYMIPGDGGRVLNQNQIGNSQSSPTVNVHNYGSSQVTTQTSTDANGQAVIDLLIQDMSNGGSYHQALQQTYGVTRKASGEL